MNDEKLSIIIGCGYLGQHLLELFEGKRVIATSRSETKLRNFKQNGYESLLLDINQTTDDFFQCLSKEKNINLFFLLPPSKVDIQALKNFLDMLKTLSIHKAVMTSSTVVYGNQARTVDADSITTIDSERAKKQHAIENIWLDTADNFSAVRLAGVYGKNRVIGTRNLQKQQAIHSNPETWLNLIHVEDAAKLLFLIAKLDRPERIELGSDNNPVKRKDYYSWLAKQLNTAAPVFENSDEARGANRKCSSLLTQQRTGWQPDYKNYEQGIRSALGLKQD